MRIKIKNHMEFGVKKDDELEVKKELSNSYIVFQYDVKLNKSNEVRINKKNCNVIK